MKGLKVYSFNVYLRLSKKTKNNFTTHILTNIKELCESRSVRCLKKYIYAYGDLEKEKKRLM